jgi:chromosomal replication initiator protein
MPLTATDEPRELARSWNAILGRLQLDVNDYNFETWLRGTRPLRFLGNTLIVEARTSFNCDFLNLNLNTVVERAAAHVLGRRVAVSFVPCGAPAATGAEAEADAGASEPPPAAAGPVIGRINASYRFESYLTAESNRLAYESCMALVEPVEFAVSPVVIFGSPGMGKTHLLHALAHRAAAGGWPVACLSAEEFTTRYQTALRKHTMEEFQESLRRVRLLIIDDLQYVAGKTGTQHELVCTIDAVIHGGGHVVCASELHPLEIDLPDRLASRLAAGIVTRVEPFDGAGRKAFIEQLSRTRRFALPTWAVDRIAGCDVSSIRVLQGAVNAAIALRQRDMLDLRRLDADLTRIAVSDAVPGALEDAGILAAVARYFDANLDDIRGRSRKVQVTRARAVAVAALKERGRSLSAIAELLDGRDPSTISELVARGHQLLGEHPDLAQRLAG